MDVAIAVDVNVVIVMPELIILLAIKYTPYVAYTVPYNVTLVIFIEFPLINEHNNPAVDAVTIPFIYTSSIVVF